MWQRSQGVNWVKGEGKKEVGGIWRQGTLGLTTVTASKVCGPAHGMQGSLTVGRWPTGCYCRHTDATLSQPSRPLQVLGSKEKGLSAEELKNHR